MPLRSNATIQCDLIDKVLDVDLPASHETHPIAWQVRDSYSLVVSTSVDHSLGETPHSIRSGRRISRLALTLIYPCSCNIDIIDHVIDMIGLNRIETSIFYDCDLFTYDWVRIITLPLLSLRSFRGSVQATLKPSQSGLVRRSLVRLSALSSDPEPAKIQRHLSISTIHEDTADTNNYRITLPLPSNGIHG